MDITELNDSWRPASQVDAKKTYQLKDHLPEENVGGFSIGALLCSFSDSFSYRRCCEYCSLQNMRALAMLSNPMDNI